MKRLGLTLAVVVVALARAVPAAGHPAPFSYIDVLLKPASLDVAVVAHIFDVAHDLGIDPADRRRGQA